MLQRIVVYVGTCAALLNADTLVLRNGRVIDGDFLGGTTRSIRMQVGERTETVDISNVSEIRFGTADSSAPAPRAQSTRPAAPTPARERHELTRQDRPLTPSPERTASASSASSGVSIPSGTSIVIRMIDDVDSQRDSVGQTYRASVDEAVSVGEQVVIPRGADVMVKLIDDKESGKLSGRTELTLDLVSVQINGRMVDVLTQEVTQASESRTARTGKVVGGTAALGAIIGAIAGGGKGAAIGAVSGAAAGGAVQVITKGQRVRIPSETRLSFVLQQPLKP